MLVTISQVNFPDFSIQHKSFCCLFFLDVVFSKGQIRKPCNACFVCGNRSYQFILFIMILTFSIRSFDIFQCINFKRNLFERTCHIFKQMCNPAANRIQQGYILKKFPFFVDQDRTCRYIIFHFHFLNFRCIFHSKCYFFCYKIAIRSKFLTQCISLSDCQTLYEVFLAFYGSPSIYHSSVFIQNRQRSAGKFHARSHIGLFHCDLCWLIFKIRR